MEGTNTQTGNGRRLVLGFDAGCVTCSDLARRIEERVGDKLEVRSLYDPQVEHWRRQVLGEDAPWTPTLIEIDGGKVRAWTGAQMGVALSLRLGFKDTWRVLQALGETNFTTNAGASAKIRTSSGLTRSQFLKSAGGVAAAVAVLTGSGKFATSALARSEDSNGVAEALKSAQKADVQGKDLINIAREATQRGDVVNVMGRAWSNKARNGRATTSTEDGQQTILVEGDQTSSPQSNGQTLTETDRIVIGAARHTLKDGTTLLIIAYRMPKNNRLLIYQEFDQAVPDGIGDLKSEATLHKVEDDELVLERASSNGSLEFSATSRSRCSGCSGAGGCRYRNRRCTRRSYRCFIATCAPCAIACGPGLALLKCIGCAVIACPYAWNFGCCRAVSYSSCRTCYRCF